MLKAIGLQIRLNGEYFSDHQIMQRFIVLAIQTFFRIAFHDILFLVYIYRTKIIVLLILQVYIFIIFAD